jgi:transposase
LQFSSTPNEIIELPVEECEVCQHDLHAVAACGRERRQVVDIPAPCVVVQEYRAEQKQCPHCQQITIAAFPAGVQAPIHYGPNVGAAAVYLVEQQLLPLARTSELMSDLQGRHGLDPLEVVDWEAQFLRVLDEGDLAHPRATAPPGKGGRCKQGDARNLLDRLRKQQKAVLNFLEDLRVDFDTNLGERDLRMVKVQQKVSGCFRSEAFAQAFARIRGSLSTLRKHGRPLLSSLQAALCGHRVLPSFERL